MRLIGLLNEWSRIYMFVSIIAFIFLCNVKVLVDSIKHVRYSAKTLAHRFKAMSLTIASNAISHFFAIHKFHFKILIIIWSTVFSTLSSRSIFRFYLKNVCQTSQPFEFNWYIVYTCLCWSGRRAISMVNIYGAQCHSPMMMYHIQCLIKYLCSRFSFHHSQCVVNNFYSFCMCMCNVHSSVIRVFDFSLFYFYDFLFLYPLLCVHLKYRNFQAKPLNPQRYLFLLDFVVCKWISIWYRFVQLVPLSSCHHISLQYIQIIYYISVCSVCLEINLIHRIAMRQWEVKHQIYIVVERFYGALWTKRVIIVTFIFLLRWLWFLLLPVM